MKLIARRRLHDGFLKVDAVTYELTQADGGSREITHEVMERGETSGVLLYNIDRKAIVLVEQVRIATVRNTLDSGRLVEIIAGGIEAGEDAAAAAIREALEETRYHIGTRHIRLEPIGCVYPSPGGSSERVHLFYGEVTNADLFGPEQLAGDEAGTLVMRHVPVEEFIAAVEALAYPDAKTLIAGAWFAAQWRKRTRSALEPETLTWRLRADPQRIIGLKTGDIGHVHGIDAWVNSENTNMALDRFIGGSISAHIRYLAAERDGAGDVIADTLGEELSQAMTFERGRRYAVPLGRVIETSAGALADTHGVRRLLHVAAVKGELGQGLACDPETLGDIVRAVLAHADTTSRGLINRFVRTQSILLPMFGAGDGRVDVARVAANIIPPAIDYLETAANLRAIYFAAYTARDRDACIAELDATAALIAGAEVT